MLFIEDSLQSSDEVALFIKLSVKTFIVTVLKTPVLSVNATRLKENLLNLLTQTQRQHHVINKF